MVADRGDIKKYLTVKEKIEEVQAECNRIEGALEQLKGRLKEEFGCNSIEEGRKLLKDMTADLGKEEDQIEKMIGEFEKTWGEKLG